MLTCIYTGERAIACTHRGGVLEESVKHFSCIGRFQGRHSLNVVNGSMLCTLMNTNI